jgi:transposase-like protein
MGDPPRSEGGTAVKCTVSVAEAISDEAVFPERVREALGQLVGAAKEGLLALSVEVGLGVLRELLEQEVDEVVGPRGKWNSDRTAVRHGHESGEVTLGGRRVSVKRPRARAADGESEVPLQTYEHFAGRDRLEGVVLERMLAGVSTRQYRRAHEPVGEEITTGERSTSKSAVSRTFVHRTRHQLWMLMNRPLHDVRLAAMMLDGIELHGYINIVALGITTEGDKLALGLWEGSTENAAVASALLSDLVDRGLDVEQGVLFIIDGSKALRKAIRQVFGSDVPVQRCVQHKQQNVLDHLPERDRQPIKLRLRSAWKETDHDRALEQLNALALELDHTHPGAAASLREGMEETLTVTRLEARREAGKPTESLPLRLLGKGDPKVTFVVGVLLTFPGVAYLDALDHIHKLNPGTAATVVLVISFCAIQLLVLELPLLGYVFSPDRTNRP